MASVADDLTAGVAALIAGLGLTGGPAVKDRKVPALAEGETDVICVAVAEDGEDWETADDAYGRAGHYRLTVTQVRRSPMTLADKAVVRERRQVIRRRLTRGPGLTGVPAVDWITALPTPEFDAGLLDGNLDYSPMAFDVKTREPRD
jgi:hypothetical protein